MFQFNHLTTLLSVCTLPQMGIFSLIGSDYGQHCLVQSFALQQSVFALQAMVHSLTATGHLCVCTLAFGSCKVLLKLPKSALRNGSSVAISHGAHSVPLISGRALIPKYWYITSHIVLMGNCWHLSSHHLLGKENKPTSIVIFLSIFLYLTSECLTATCADPNWGAIVLCVWSHILISSLRFYMKNGCKHVWGTIICPLAASCPFPLASFYFKLFSALGRVQVQSGRQKSALSLFVRRLFSSYLLMASTFCEHGQFSRPSAN